MTLMGHREPQYLVNEESYTIDIMESPWEQAARPHVRLHSNRTLLLLPSGCVHRNMATAVVKGSPRQTGSGFP